jgi:hypothetical protein
MRQGSIAVVVLVLVALLFGPAHAQQESQGITADPTGCFWSVSFPLHDYSHVTWRVNGQIVERYGTPRIEKCFTESIEYKVTATVWHTCVTSRTEGSSDVAERCQGLEYSKTWNPVPLSESWIKQAERISLRLVYAAGTVAVVAFGIFQACRLVGLCNVRPRNGGAQWEAAYGLSPLS